MGEVVICHGPAARDRSRRLLEERLRKSRGGSPEYLYVVASRWRKQQLAREFLQTNPSTFEIPILTFQDLVSALFREIGSGRRVVSETGRRWLLEAVLEEQVPATGGNGEEPRVSLSEAGAWVSTLKGRGLTSEPLIRLHLQREDRDPAEASRLIRIFLAYQKKLEARGWEDAAGVRMSLYEALLTGSLDCRDRFPRVGEILFEGLIARTPVEKGLVRLLADQVGKAVFSLDLESPDEETGPFKLPVSTVRECWEGMNPAWRFQAVGEAPAQVRFCRPVHREAEVRTVAREIRELKIREPRLRWSRVGVVCPRDESYLLLLREIFPRLQIPWLNLHGDALGSANAFRVLTGYVELLWRDFRRDDLFDFLSSPWIHPDGLSPDRIWVLEQRAFRGGFRGGREVWTDAFPEWIEGKPSPSAEDSVPEGCAEAFREWVRKLQADSSRLRTAAEWVSLLSGRLGPLLRPPGGHGDWGRTEGQALVRLQASLQEAALLWGDCPLSLARFRSLLRRQVSRIRISPALDRDAVVVGSARHLQECEFRHLFWLDFSEGRIPSRRPAPFSETADRVAEELSIFHGLRCRSRESVLLSSPRHADNGPVLPSHVLEYLDCGEKVLPPAEMPRDSAASAAKGENIHRGVRALTLRRSVHPHAFGGVLGRPGILDRMRRRHFPHGMDVSPELLEEYGRCGFRFFVRTILGAKPPPDSALVREQHRLVRRILSRYSKDAAVDRPPDLEDGRRRMAGIVREELEELKQAWPAAGGLRWEQMQAWLMDGLEDSNPPGLLMRFLEEELESGLEIHSAETSLGPLVLGHLPNGEESGAGRKRPVRLGGRLDRIERTPEGFRLVSYVTGQRNRLRGIKEGWGFRLPLSLLLIHSHLGKAASGGFYHAGLPGYLKWRPLRKPGSRAPADDLEQLMDRYREEALLASRRIWSGTFPVTPHKPAVAGCAHCSTSRVCRREETQAGGTRA
ncbi:MAG: PD-(D/E)XK nuclease family protein [Candidatus Aminicenantes bacterium]|nr:PD-(D/E)XK nuclease family protein [Candidatus Aminicenantes bacterium]